MSDELVVVATDEATARWAATPIETLQPRSPLTPLVLGPDLVPRVSTERALREPWMAVLSALVHGQRADGTDVIRAALHALRGLPEEQANICYDVIRATLNEDSLRALEVEMRTGKYEYQSDFARHYFGEGRLENARSILLALADRHGPVSDEARARVMSCADLDQLRATALEIAGAADLPAVEALLAKFPATRDH